MSRIMKLLAAVLALTMLASACGDDDGCSGDGCSGDSCSGDGCSDGGGGSRRS